MTEKPETSTPALFRGLVRNDGKLVAGLAVILGGAARFFILERRESDEAFIGRVSTWIKDQGADGLRMEKPDVIPEGIAAPEFLLRLRTRIAVEGSDPDASEFDVKNPSQELTDPEKAN
jgi:hypothetical protein